LTLRRALADDETSLVARDEADDEGEDSDEQVGQEGGDALPEDDGVEQLGDVECEDDGADVDEQGGEVGDEADGGGAEAACGAFEGRALDGLVDAGFGQQATSRAPDGVAHDGAEDEIPSARTNAPFSENTVRTTSGQSICISTPPDPAPERSHRP